MCTNKRSIIGVKCMNKLEKILLIILTAICIYAFYSFSFLVFAYANSTIPPLPEKPSSDYKYKLIIHNRNPISDMDIYSVYYSTQPMLIDCYGKTIQTLLPSDSYSITNTGAHATSHMNDSLPVVNYYRCASYSVEKWDGTVFGPIQYAYAALPLPSTNSSSSFRSSTSNYFHCILESNYVVHDILDNVVFTPKIYNVLLYKNNANINVSQITDFSVASNEEPIPIIPYRVKFYRSDTLNGPYKLIQTFRGLDPFFSFPQTHGENNYDVWVESKNLALTNGFWKWVITDTTIANGEAYTRQFAENYFQISGMGVINKLYLNKGQGFESAPEIRYQKKSVDFITTITINEHLINTIGANVDYNSLLKIPSDFFVQGDNYIILKDNNGNIIQSETFVLSGPPGPGSGENSVETVTEGRYGKEPIADDYPDTIVGKVEYLTDKLMYWLKFPFEWLADIVKKFIDTANSFLGSITSFIKAISGVFAYLPEPLPTVLPGFVLLSFIILIYKMMRGGGG